MKSLSNVFAITGISLSQLLIIALFFRAKWLNILTLPQVLSANIKIYLGITFSQTLKLKYSIIELLLENALIARVMIKKHNTKFN